MSALIQLPTNALLANAGRRTPDAIAVECGARSLTYAELDARSNQLARVLRTRGAGPGVLVGLLVERSCEMAAALLAIWKAGAAYVPLDARHGARVQQILDQAQPKLLIGDSASLKSVAKVPAQVVELDCPADILSGIADGELEPAALPSDLAYVIFTSGSTGQPKGVEIEHRSLLNLLRSVQRQPGFTAADTLLAVTTLAFDIAGLEIYLPLLAGGRVVIADAEVASDGRRLMQLLDCCGATVMQATPATWRLLLGSGWRGNCNLKALVGGEALSPELARELAARCGQVWNMYGPTETTVWSTLYRVSGREERSVPIGGPIANTSLYVLGASGEPVEPGREGELYIGGDGVARGYLNRPGLTAEKFLPDPFSPVAGARMYRTGDLARCRPDGNLEFLGRTDHQVKVRGYRIELGEIESVLERHSAVRQAVAVARENSGEKEIVAYVLPRACGDRGGAGTPSIIPALRRHCGDWLPEYMAPSVYVAVAEFPLTPNGKVDRSALPAPEVKDLTAGQQFVAPRDAVERKLASLWEEILDLRVIGVASSFFELGGRSLQAARLFMKIGREFHIDLPLSTLFRAPTIEALARELRAGASKAAYRTIIPIRPEGSRPPFFCVHGGAGSTLFLHKLARHLNTAWPFYGIEPEGLDGRRFERHTIEQMAAHYVSEMRAVEAEGPYFLGGYCFGGLVAVEMAQQLRRAGETTALLALFSAPLRFNRAETTGAPLSRSARARLQRFIASPGKILARKVPALARSLRTRLELGMCEFLLSAGKTVPPFLRSGYVDLMLRRAEWKYVPSFYEGTLHLFYGGGLWDHDPSLGWDGLAGCLEHRVIGQGRTAARREIMDEPLVGLLAEALTGALDQAWRSEPDFTGSMNLGGRLE